MVSFHHADPVLDSCPVDSMSWIPAKAHAQSCLAAVKNSVSIYYCDGLDPKMCPGGFVQVLNIYYIVICVPIYLGWWVKLLIAPMTVIKALTVFRLLVAVSVVKGVALLCTNNPHVRYIHFSTFYS